MLFAVIVLDRRRREVAGVVAGVDDLRFCLGVLISSAREVPASIASVLLSGICTFAVQHGPVKRFTGPSSGYGEKKNSSRSPSRGSLVLPGISDQITDSDSD